MEPQERVEREIYTSRRKELWTPFLHAIRQYGLLRAGDRVAVCVSGGKDSMLMAKLFQALHRVTEIPFDVLFLTMDPGYSPTSRALIERNASALGVPLQFFETDIFDTVEHSGRSPCYLCARMRRGHLYHKAQDLGCNKIALGHHFNDVVETVLMSLLYGAQFQTMMPMLKSQNWPGMELIRPLYHVREADILAWKRRHNLTFLQCACRLTENCALSDGGGSGGKRQEVKELLRTLKQTNPTVEKSIFNSIHSVNLDTVIGYRQGGAEHSFLETYDESTTEDSP